MLKKLLVFQFILFLIGSLTLSPKTRNWKDRKERDEYINEPGISKDERFNRLGEIIRDVLIEKIKSIDENNEWSRYGKSIAEDKEIRFALSYIGLERGNGVPLNSFIEFNNRPWSCLKVSIYDYLYDGLRQAIENESPLSSKDKLYNKKLVLLPSVDLKSLRNAIDKSTDVDTRDDNQMLHYGDMDSINAYYKIKIKGLEENGYITISGEILAVEKGRPIGSIGNTPLNVSELARQCYNYTAQDKTIKSIDTDGIDLSHFYHHSTTEEMDISNYSPKALEELRKRTFLKAFDEFRQVLPVDISPSLRALIESGKIKIDDIAEKRTILHRIISIYSQEGIFKYSEGKYTFQISLITPQNVIYIFPDEFRYILNEYVDLELNKLDLKYQKIVTGIEIDIGRIIINLAGNEMLSKKLKPMAEKYKDLIINLDPDTKKFIQELLHEEFELSNFPSGDYSISTIMAFTINKVKNRLKDIINQNPRTPIEITCYGYTDQVKVRERGIPYTGKGKWSYAGDAIDFTQDLERTSDKPLQPTIWNNLQLSYARAYSGTEYFKNIFPQYYIKNGIIHLKYQGKGIDKTSTKNNSYKRRIVFFAKKSRSI